MEIPEYAVSATLSLPYIGLGTWELRGKACENAVRMALEIGYRHIDTAHLYENHEEIRRAIEGFPRDELILVSKFLSSHLTNATVEATCDQSLQELGTDYLDLYLLHSPDRSAPMQKILQDLSTLVVKGKCREVGVSNFTIGHLQDMLNWNLTMPVNQVEFHCYLNQEDLLAFCQEHSIAIVSYRPLGKGALIKDPILQKIGKKHGKTAAQISLRWLVEKEIPVIPKASSRKHLEENFALFDFALDEEDHEILDHLTSQHRYCNPEWSDFEY